MQTHNGAGWQIRLYDAGEEVAEPSSSPRKITPDHILELYVESLLTDPLWDHSKDATLEAVVKLSKATTFIAEEPKAGLIGFAAMTDDVVPHINQIYVLPDWRFCGVGSSLLETARNSTDSCVTLHVHAGNASLIGALKRLGWIAYNMDAETIAFTSPDEEELF